MNTVRRLLVLQVVVAVSWLSTGCSDEKQSCAAPAQLTYYRAGCGVSRPAPMCEATFDPCLGVYCSCDGKVTVGTCTAAFAPYGRPLPPDTGMREGDPCDPFPDGGADSAPSSAAR